MTNPLDGIKSALADHYVIECELGRGGMAVVYLAEDLRHARKVAVKVLRPELAVAVGSERFLREIEIAGRLHHPHIVPVYDSGRANGFLYYVMPYVEGESLRDRLLREKQLPLNDAIQIAREIADALSYAHSHSVVHRDVKPENIMLESGHATITDFGVARALTAAGGEQLTETGMAVGTPAYMSPEQAAGNVEIDGRSDIYSLACVVYEMLGGEPPYTGPTPQAVLARKLTEEVRSLRPIRNTVTPALDTAIRKALSPTPADRYATAQDFGAVLVRPSAVWRALQRPTMPRTLVAGTAAGLVVAAGIILAVRGGGAPPALDDDDRIGLAVFPFRAANAAAARWTEQLPDLLSIVLDGTPGVRVADPWSLWRPLRSTREARAVSPRDREEAEQMARTSRAGRFVLGTVAGDSLRINVQLRVYQRGTDEPLYSLALETSVDSMSVVVQQMAAEVITRVAAGSPDVPTVEDYATGSADALKAYLQAKEFMRRGLVDSADAAIDRSLALDSTFALALVEATGIKSWKAFVDGELFMGLMELAERAVQHSDPLSERNRLRAEATLASVRTEGPAAARAAEGIVRLDSTDLGAWSSLAYYHTVYGWQYGKDAEDARDAAERVVQLDPTHVLGLLTRLQIAIGLDDPEDINRQVERLRNADTTSAMVRQTLVALRALAVDDETFLALADTVAASSFPTWVAVLRQLRVARPARADSLLRRLGEAADQEIMARQLAAARTRLWIAEGRLHRADSAIRDGELGDDNIQQSGRLNILAAAVAGMVDEELAARTAADVAGYVTPDSALAHFNTRPVWHSAWNLGAYHATLGDTATARRWYNVIGTLPPGGSGRDYRGGLQSDIEARLALRRGDLDLAHEMTEQAYDLWSIHTENDTEYWPSPAIRFQLAMVLDQRGLSDSAGAILRSLVPPTTWMGFYTPRAFYELGRIAENQGELEAAALHYARALQFWEHGGPEVDNWRRLAEGALDRVGPERRR
jgi:tetratricopeptide (TPR) repeat protein